jgi:hypothetical protein
MNDSTKDDSIKSLTITGTAAEDGMKSRRPSSRKRRQKVEDIYEEPDPLAPPEPPMPVRPIARTPQQVLQQPVKPQQQQQQQQPQQQPQQQQQADRIPWKAPPISQEGGQPTGKIVLNPPKTPRIKLQPKTSQVAAKVSPQATTNTTRKARRFRLTVSNLNHRFTRAKKVTEHSNRQPIQSIRDYLLQKGVIQAKSKAPEKMLRSMYSDFMILKDPAL